MIRTRSPISRGNAAAYGWQSVKKTRYRGVDGAQTRYRRPCERGPIRRVVALRARWTNPRNAKGCGYGSRIAFAALSLSGTTLECVANAMVQTFDIKHTFALAARCARAVHRFHPPRARGRGESRAPIAPAVVHKKRTSRPQGNRIIRLSLHDGLRLIRDHPGDRAFLPPSPCGLTMPAKPGWARDISAGLDASVGASGLHDFAVRACPAKALAGPRPYPASFVEDSFQRRSSARRIIAHGVDPALRSLARPTLSRPSHPTARS